MCTSAPPVLPFADDAQQVVKEYEAFLTSITIDQINPSKLHITTKENVQLIINVNSSGWQVDKVDGKYVPR